MLQTKGIAYERSKAFQLKDIDLTIREGEIVSIIGPNGSGKSTYLRVISRLIKPNQGEVVIDGQLIQAMKSIDVAKKLAMLPQIQDHQLDLTVGELVEFGRYPHRGGHGRLTKADKEIIEWAIEVTKLSNYRDRLLETLSGGERQRAWIAMAVAQRPKVLLLDEPTTFLDIAHQLEVMELVKELNVKFNMTIIMVLHDINQAARYSNRLVVLKEGMVQFDGIPQCVLCREMFQSIFEIDADIYEENGKTFFTPIRLKKAGIK